MDQPLGRSAGHSAEIIECIDVLRGKGPADLRDLSFELAAWMFFFGERTRRSMKAAPRRNDDRERKSERKIQQGIALQGGDPRVVDEPERLPARKIARRCCRGAAPAHHCDECEQLGIALAILGGGREKKEEPIDHGVALEFHKRIGDAVEKGEPLVTIHYNADARLAEAKSMIAASYEIAAEPPRDKPPLIRSADRRVIWGIDLSLTQVAEWVSTD